MIEELEQRSLFSIVPAGQPAPPPPPPNPALTQLATALSKPHLIVVRTPNSSNNIEAQGQHCAVQIGTLVYDWGNWGSGDQIGTVRGYWRRMTWDQFRAMYSKDTRLEFHEIGGAMSENEANFWASWYQGQTVTETYSVKENNCGHQAVRLIQITNVAPGQPARDLLFIPWLAPQQIIGTKPVSGKVDVVLMGTKQ